MTNFSITHLSLVTVLLLGGLLACQPQEPVLAPTPSGARISAASLIPGVEVVGLTETISGYGYDQLAHAFDRLLLGLPSPTSAADELRYNGPCNC
ncbi:hypothetical protein [Spirosoma montaniterrae]|uniref:Uncharacterized protein n=1 Tax=Spirosoma montaniterrae TaxID=1178516 RepID=A0A1P9WT74_9BACT|nr:hypothetical protein [Spirosoma montaniterrae]AQG78533.1 hypothetical protein AWR27_03765 [Spirosoma montaniterrae]